MPRTEVTAPEGHFERTLRVLQWIIWPSYAIIGLGAAVFIGLGITPRPDLTLLFHGTGLAIVAAGHFLARQGRVRLASDVLTAFFFCTYSAAAFLSGGTTSPYMGGFLLVIVGAGLLRGGPMGLGYTALSVGMGATFVLLDLLGQVPPPLIPMTPLFSLVAWTLILGMTGILLHVTLSELYRALGRAQASEAALEAALEELHATSVSKASVEAVLSGLGDAVFVLDAAGSIEDTNPAASQLLGHPSSDLHQSPFASFGPADLPTEGSIETELLAESGPVHVSLSVAELRGTRGELEGRVVVAHDIDARVEAENRIRRAAHEAEENSRAKSSFLATMSHELRTPLNAIIGYAEFVQEELEDPTLASDVHRIERSGRNLLGLINDVLDLSKIEAGRIEIEHRPLLLPALFADIADEIRPLVETNGNALDLVLELPAQEVVTDGMRLRQILRNLLSNAAKFTERGTIRLEAHHDDGSLTIHVIDEGIGMTEEQLQRIWEPFAQAEASTTRRFGGTGLGLPITLHLCELLGGDIQAISAPGEGTRFQVRLPAPESSC